jgi:hypothetical protein
MANSPTWLTCLRDLCALGAHRVGIVGTKAKWGIHSDDVYSIACTTAEWNVHFGKGPLYGEAVLNNSSYR